MTLLDFVTSIQMIQVMNRALGKNGKERGLGRKLA